MPELIVTESSYEFIPPHTGNFWPKFLGFAATRLIRRKHRICEVEVRGADRIAELLKQQHGLLLAPNHCRMSDALVLQQLSRKLSQPFFVMASSHLFRDTALMKWALRRLGAFSVYREGVDRQAIQTAIEVVSQGKRPLVVFPEGALSHANDQLNALMEGVSFIARSAAKKVEKQNRESATSRQVFMVPIALRYLFQGDLAATVNPILSDIEKRLAWRTQDQLPLVDRIYKVGNALLGLKETEFAGKPSTGDINDRLRALINHLLHPMEEEWLSGVQTGSVINRVKELRKTIVPDMINDVDEGDSHTLLAPEELDRRWRQLEDMSFAQALSLFPRDYIASRPSTDRILETVERIAETLSGDEQAHGPMKAIIQIGAPFPVSGKRDRSGDGDPVMKQLEDQLSSMLADLSTESAVYPGATA